VSVCGAGNNSSVTGEVRRLLRNSSVHCRIHKSPIVPRPYASISLFLGGSVTLQWTVVRLSNTRVASVASVALHTVPFLGGSVTAVDCCAAVASVASVALHTVPFLVGVVTERQAMYIRGRTSRET
jgi:hypothetical protein